MPLPHRINITSGGTGLDIGEMFFGCQRDAVDGPPGFGSRGFSPGEDALSKNFNRSAFALAENDEYLGDILVKQEFAVAEVGALTGFTGNQIAIDPSGAALGDINYSGSLYMGDAGWANTQENRDTLFQILDENYNEVYVDGVEVKVTGFVGGAVGDGFKLTLVSLGLNKTLPSGNYRVGYGRGRTFETMPAYAMIRADIRGLHEAPGEAARPSVFVLDPSSTPTKLADFWGPTCFQDALAAIGHNNITLFLRAGSYTVHAAGVPGTALTVALDGVTVVGESRGAVSLNLQAGHDLHFTGGRISLQSVNVVGNVAGGADLIFDGGRTSLIGVGLSNLKLTLDMTPTGDDMDAVLIDVIQSGTQSRGAYFNGGSPISGAVVSNCTFYVGVTGNTVCEIADSRNIAFQNCFFNAPSAVIVADVLLISNSIKLSFVNCYAHSAGTGMALIYGDSGTPADLVEATFSNCDFKAEAWVVDVNGGANAQNVRLKFSNCKFESTGTTRYNGVICRFDAMEYRGSGWGGGADPSERGIDMENCTITDKACKFLNNSGVAAGPGIHFKNARVRGLAIDRSDAVDFRCNGPLLELQHTVLDTLDVEEDYSNPQAVEHAGTGRIAILEGATLSNVKVSELRENWTYPLFYVKGEFRATPNRGARAILDGAIVSTQAAQTWSQTGLVDNGLVALLVENAQVRHVNVPEDVALSATSTQALIHVDGSDCEVIDNDLRPATGKITYHIRVRGNETFGTRILRNTIYFMDVAWARNGAAAIYVIGSGGGNARHGLIRGNRIAYLTDMTDDLDAPAVHKVIILGLNVYCWIIAENDIATRCKAGVLGGAFVICIEEAPYGTNLVPGGGSNCVGNTLRDLNNLNVPDIGTYNVPSAAVVTAGDPTNTLIQGGI